MHWTFTKLKKHALPVIPLAALTVYAAAFNTTPAKGAQSGAPMPEEVKEALSQADLSDIPIRGAIEPAPMQDLSTLQAQEAAIFKGTPSNEPMSMQEALDEGLFKSPRVESIRKTLGIAKSQYWQAATLPNPSFVTNNGFGGLSFQQAVTIPIEPPWKIALRLVAAKQQVKQSKLDIARQLWAFRGEVRRTFTEAVLAQELYYALSDLTEIADYLLDVSRKRFKAGDVPELDVLKAQLAYSQATTEQNFAAVRVLRAKQQLNIILGRPQDQTIAVPRLISENKSNITVDLLPDFSYPLPELSHFMETAKNNRLELKLVKQSIKANQALLANAYGNIIPTPSFTFGNDFSGNPPKPSIATSGLLFLGSIPLPIVDVQQGEIARLIATIKQLRKEYAAQENLITAQVSSAYFNVIATREKIRTYQKQVLAESKEVTRLARRSYEVGQSDITSTMQVQQANIQVRNQYVESVLAYQLAYTELEQSLGIPAAQK